VRTLDARIDQDRLGDPPGQELAGLWRAHRTEIGVAADRAQRLGRAVAAARPRPVLCHGDLHTANLLVDHRDRLAVVDWDGLLLAPRERDLMFVADEEWTRFLEGHGPAALDRTVLAYYRWEWVVQELADYGGRVLDDRLGGETRRQAVAEFAKLFTPGDVVEAARAADRGLEVS
jgi:spectinomycin phosphotransferase